MKLSEFKIDGYFWTGVGKWKCFDVGTKTVVAHKCGLTTKTFHVTGHNFARSEIRTFDPEKVPWYELDFTTFYDYDFGGCWATEEEYKAITYDRR